jgi:hypothetical protein
VIAGDFAEIRDVAVHLIEETVEFVRLAVVVDVVAVNNQIGCLRANPTNQSGGRRLNSPDAVGEPENSSTTSMPSAARASYRAVERHALQRPAVLADDDDDASRDFAVREQLARILDQMIGRWKLVRQQRELAVIVFKAQLPVAGFVMADVQLWHAMRARRACKVTSDLTEVSAPADQVEGSSAGLMA